MKIQYRYQKFVTHKSDPTATLQFEVKMASGSPKRKSCIVKIGDNLSTKTRNCGSQRCWKPQFLLVGVAPKTPKQPQ